MIQRPPRSTRTNPLVPSPTLSRPYDTKFAGGDTPASAGRAHCMQYVATVRAPLVKPNGVAYGPDTTRQWPRRIAMHRADQTLAANRILARAAMTRTRVRHAFLRQR